MATNEKFHVNSVDIEGIVTKVWDRNGDVFARLAIYDENAEVLEPPKKKGDLPKRQAHYVTLQFTDGKTDDGVPVSLSAKDHIRATGYLRDASYSESLTTFLRKAKQFERIRDRDDERRVGRVATYIVVKTLIRFSN
jgi:hypothetical protein